MAYDSCLFIEVIDSIQGIAYLRQETRNGVKLFFYQGLQGNLVVIDISDEDIADSVGKGYLTQLGVPHLIPSLFPEAKDEPLLEALIDEKKMEALIQDKEEERKNVL